MAHYFLTASFERGAASQTLKKSKLAEKSVKKLKSLFLSESFLIEIVCLNKRRPIKLARSVCVQSIENEQPLNCFLVYERNSLIDDDDGGV